MRNDVNHIRFKFETLLDTVGWILNLADVGTKPYSTLIDGLALTLESGKMSLDLSWCEFTSRH